MKNIGNITEKKEKVVVEEVITGKTLSFTNDELEYIRERLECSSFDTFRKHMEARGYKHISRASFYANFVNVING
jgi:hypothetical protein